ncbi:12436_t:CDS:2, partial [Ambispora leptoticha]
EKHRDNISNIRDNELRELRELLKNKVYNLAPDVKKWNPIHILELAEWGGIRPHVDNIEYSGKVIMGVSLISSAVMIFRHVDDPSCAFSVLLEPGSLYIQRGSVRSKFTHEIPMQPENHVFRGNLIPKGRRVSLIFR